MREIEESGFKVSLPENTSFRICELAVFKKLSGLHLKEMDVGWWDGEKNRLILMELKGQEIWDEFDNNHEEAHKYLINALSSKANDVLLILGAVWSSTELGIEIKGNLPTNAQKYPSEGNLKFIFLIDTPASRKTLLSPLKDRINQVLAGRTRLFGIKRVTLVDFDTAQKMGLPVHRP